MAGKMVEPIALIPVGTAHYIGMDSDATAWAKPSRS